MYIVYDKKDLSVIAILDNNSSNIANSKTVEKMFPGHQLIDIWEVSIDHSIKPNQLRVLLDDLMEPKELLCNGKSIYTVTDSEKNKRHHYRIDTLKKQLSNSYPPSFVRSLNAKVINFWKSSIYTSPEIRESLADFSYFSGNKISPVTWWGPYTDAGGYASMNRSIAFRLHNYHVIPRIEICPTAPQISPLANYYISNYTSIDVSRFKRKIKVWGFTPCPHPPENGKNIMYTMMETETLHPEFVRLCNSYSDEVWVPTKHNEVVFKKSGVKKPIYVFPLGIDEKVYACQNEIIYPGDINDTSHLVSVIGKPISEGINKFRFITLFGWSFRKGTDILIKSFVEAFTEDDDVALIIVSRYAGASNRGGMNVIIDDVSRYAHSIRKKNFPQILLYPDVIPEGDMPKVYKMGHAFFHTSRGEGFSLPQIEAAACGLPVISCNNTGMSEYLNDSNSYMITTNETEIGSPEMHWITPFYHGQLFPKLGREQILQASSHLKYVRSNYDEALRKARILKEDVFSKYTWDIATQKISNRLKELYL